MTTSATGDRLESVLRHDRMLVGLALAVLVAAAWLYLARMAVEMSSEGHASMATMSMLAMQMWDWPEVVLLAVMWAIMMVAMMVPAATPMILMFAAIHRRRAASGGAAVSTSVFVLGYLAVWTAFSIVAALVQAALHMAAVISPAMAATSPLIAAGVLVAAGVFQWTPLKHTCLAACRSPLTFVMTRWREGRAGALRMGVRHGLYCLGCCWVLMALLFVAGVMNLAWVAILAVAVLVERLVPRGELVARGIGIALVAAGVWVSVPALVR